MDPFAKTRTEALRRFASYAAQRFAEQPARRSITLAVAQYWNDEADDALHGEPIISTRETPVWPHECAELLDERGGYLRNKALLPGEECPACDGVQLWTAPSFHGGYGDDMVQAFELYCRENAHQEMDTGEAYVPYAIARRSGDDVEVEVVGRPQRPPVSVLGAAEPAGELWSDERTRAMYREVCLNAREDGPRVVLSDHLLEAHPGEPRGEAIALAMKPALDADARRRRDELVATHLVRWIHPLGRVIPPGCAQLERGLLARAHVYARDDEDLAAVRGAAAWGTVEVLRMIPGSRDVVDPAMLALRDLGAVGREGVARLGEAPGPWAIERLHTRLDGVAPHTAIGLLARAATLPRLHHLVLDVADNALLASGLARLATAPWWLQLEHLTLVVRALDPLDSWKAHRPGHTRLSIALPGDDLEPAGWEVSFGPDNAIEITMAGYHGSATLPRLAEIVNQLTNRPIRLVSSPTRVFTKDDAIYLLEHTGREVAVS